jgi:hypothetical protein
MYNKRMIWTLALVMLLSACASTVRKPDGGGPVPAGTKASGKNVVLNVTGSDVRTSADDWADFQGIWKDECLDEFHQAEANFTCSMGRHDPLAQKAF